METTTGIHINEIIDFLRDPPYIKDIKSEVIIRIKELIGIVELNNLGIKAGDLVSFLSIQITNIDSFTDLTDVRSRSKEIANVLIHYFKNLDFLTLFK